jgi:MFS family permease
MPLMIRDGLGLGPAAFGSMLGVAGFGAVAAGTVLPMIRDRLSQGRLVFFASLLAYAAMALLGFSRHWAPAALAVLIFGAAWLVAGSTLGAAAQMTAPAWVRARALGVYHLAFFGALAMGSLLWGWVGTKVGVPTALALCAGSGAVAAVVVRPWRLVNFAQDMAQRIKARRGKEAPALPTPEAPASALKALLHDNSGRVLEVVRYQVDPTDLEAFLTAMRHVREVRLRAGAAGWRLYRDLAQPDYFTELWAVDSWTDYLRHAVRLEDADRAALALVAEMHRGGQGPEASRHLNVEP